MKNKIIKIFSFIPFLVTGCKDIKNKEAIFVLNNKIYNTSISSEADANMFPLINLNVDDFKNFVVSKQTFNVFFYSTTCHYCDTSKDVLIKYLNNSKQVFYSLEIDSLSFSALRSFDSSLFNDSFVTPSLMVFNKGALTYNYSHDNILRQYNFNKEAKRLTKSTNIDYVNDISTYFDSKNHKEFLAYFYSLDDVDSLKFGADNIFDIAAKSSKKTLYLNQKYCNFSTISQELSTELSNKNPFYIVTYEKGKLKIIDYKLESENALKAINAFYR